MNNLTFDDLRKANAARAIEWKSNTLDFVTDLLFRSNELVGEAGEAANKVKKIARTRLGMVGGSPEGGVADLAEELADVIICVDRVAELFGLPLDAIVRAKFNKTSINHGFKARL